MKQITTFLICTLTVLSMFSQCPSGTVSLNSQADVQNFADTYPDCETINGALRIQGQTVTDLTPLNDKIKTVTSDFVINNTSITNLNGLSGIENVGYGLSITSNNALTTLSGLNNLSYVFNNVRVNNNPQLINIDAIVPVVPSVYVEIKDNAILSDLNGFSTITSIYYLVLENNASLSDLSDFSNMDSIGNLILKDNAINSLTSFQDITSISNLSITNEANLTSILGVQNLGSLSSLVLIDCTNFSSLNDFPDVSFMNSIQIVNCPALTNLDGLESLISINNFRIENNGLRNIDGLSNLENINGFGDVFLVDENLESFNLTSLMSAQFINYFSFRAHNTDNVCGIANFFENGTYSGSVDFYADSGNLTSTAEVINYCSTLSTESYIEQNLTIYPNPTRDGIIHFSDNTSKDIKIYNILGNRIYSQNQITKTMDLSALNKGIYLLSISSNDIQTSKKIIID